MNSINKKATGNQSFKRPVGHAPQIKPGVAQLKPVVTAQNVKRPVAPPVYRPQPAPKVLQKKVSPVQSSPAHQAMPRQPVAPPVYRPQPTRATVQAKLAGPTQTKRPALAAPLCRAQPVPKVLQMKKTVSQPVPYKPQHAPLLGSRSSVVQRKYGKETYVEVNGPGGTWYGVVTGIRHHATGTLRIRVGGTDQQVEVPEGQVRLHPTIAKSRAALAAAARMVAASKEERRDGESVSTAGGTWTAVEYNSKMGYYDPNARGLHMKLMFTPNHTVDATNIVLVQTVRATKNQNPYFLDESVRARAVDDVSIDQMGDSVSPEYAANPETSGGGFGSAAVQRDSGEHGYRYRTHSGHWTVKSAWLQDNPTMREVASASGQVFETTAIAAAGNDRGRYYGSVRWGWSWAPGGVVRLVPLAVVTSGYGASAEFRRSADRWNRTRVGQGVDARDPVQLPLPP